MKYAQSRVNDSVVKFFTERKGYAFIAEHGEYVWLESPHGELHIVKCSHIVHKKFGGYRTELDSTAPSWDEREADDVVGLTNELMAYPPFRIHLDVAHINVIVDGEYGEGQGYMRLERNAMVYEGGMALA